MFVILYTGEIILKRVKWLTHGQLAIGSTETKNPGLLIPHPVLFPSKRHLRTGWEIETYY